MQERKLSRRSGWVEVNLKEDVQRNYPDHGDGDQGKTPPFDGNLEPISPLVIDQVNRLSHQMVETEAALEKIISSEVDAVIDPVSSAPVLLQKAQEALRKSEGRYHRLITRMLALVFELTPDGTVLEINEAITRLSGYQQAELIGQNLWSMLCKDCPKEQIKDLLAKMQEGDVSNYELSLTAKGGEQVILELNSANYYDNQGLLEGIVGFGVDITPRKQAERAVERANTELERRVALQTAELRNANQRLETVLQSLPVAVMIADRTGRIVEKNDMVDQIWGGDAPLSPTIEDYGQYSGWWIEGGEKLKPDEWPLARAVSQGEIVMGEVVDIQRFDGTYGTIINSAAPIYDTENNLVGAVVASLDITEQKRAEEALQKAHEELERRVLERTKELAKANQELLAEIIERKQTEQALRESEERYRLIVNNAKEYAIFTLDTEGYVTSWNRGAQNIKGYTAEEIIGKHFSCFYPPEELAQGAPQKYLQKAKEDGRFETEGWRVRKDGTRFWANVVITPLRDDAGQLRGFSKVVRDMSRRKKADEALRRQTEFVKLLQEVAVAANQAVTVEGAMQFALDRICAVTGWKVGLAYSVEDWSKKELAPMHLSTLSDARRYAKFRKVSEEARYTPGEGLPGIVYQRGAPVWLEDVFQEPAFTRQDFARESGLKLGVAFPVMVGRKVVGALEFFGDESRPPDEDLLSELAHIGTQLGRVVERKQSENALKRSEARFRTIFEGAAMGIELVDLEGHLLAWNPALAEILGYREDELRRNALFKVDHPANVVANGVENAHLFADMCSGGRDFFRLEQRYERKDKQVVWGKLSASLVRDINGQPQFVIGMLEDITERKQMEEELIELQRRLMEGREAERLHLAQELHDGPVQDLYGISYNLKAFTDSMLEEPDNEDMLDLQKNLQKVVKTLRAICGELRPPALAPFGLEKAIRSHAGVFQNAHPELTIGLDLMPDGQNLPEAIRLALYRIYQQALNNVIRHAQARHVMIRFAYDEEQLMLEIQDDGHGFNLPLRWIDLARQGHMGLVGSAERAESIGGRLTVESKLDEGTTIRVTVNGRGEREKSFLSRFLS
jgi:PAS domain S-box-containing protein